MSEGKRLDGDVMTHLYFNKVLFLREDQKHFQSLFQTIRLDGFLGRSSCRSALEPIGA